MDNFAWVRMALICSSVYLAPPLGQYGFLWDRIMALVWLGVGTWCLIQERKDYKIRLAAFETQRKEIDQQIEEMRAKVSESLAARKVDE